MFSLLPTAGTSKGERGLKTKRPPTRESAARLQRHAQQRADEQARRIPWQQLQQTREEYIDWQEFCLWVRSIIEAEGCMPEWLTSIVEQRCPGFLQSDSERTSTRPLSLRLEDWIGEHIFGNARKEGWFHAVEFYSVRDPRYQRAEVCWSECAGEWAQSRPIRYPSFEEWRAMAVACDETAHLVSEQRKTQASSKLVDRGRLAQAISSYIDWEAFAYWARPALEHGQPVPEPVREELDHRCPGFLDRSAGTENVCAESFWEDMMTWIAEQFFADAKAEGWFDAILIGAHRHPRAIRTMEYAEYWDDLRGPSLPVPYPSFEDWRSDADSYIEAEPS